MDVEEKKVLALFYCQNTPQSSERERQSLEEKYGKSLRLFPIPCGGRLEPLHLLRALEEFADAAYVITCPNGCASPYSQGHEKGGGRGYASNYEPDKRGLCHDYYDRGYPYCGERSSWFPAPLPW